jgi:hypothetical protein
VKLGLLVLREEHRLRVLEDRGAAENILPEDTVRGRKRKLCNESLHHFYSLTKIIKVNKSRKMVRSE